MTNLDLNEFEIIDAIPVPLMGDRLVRLRTLEEAIEDLMATDENKGEDVHGYFIQVRPKVRPQPTPSPVTDPTDVANEPNIELKPPIGMAEGIYLADGALNLTQLLRSAELLFRAREYGPARKIYKAIMRTGERPWQAACEIGRCFEAEGKFEEARAQYEESIAYQPLAPTFRYLVSLLIRLKKDQEAAEILDRAVLLKDLPEETRCEFHQTAGNCWNRRGNAKDAERHYRRALDIRPESDEVRCNLGVLYLQAGRLPAAQEQFQSALDANPRAASALMGLGSAALAAGDASAAHAYFARSLKIEIRNPTAIFHLIKCAYEIRSYPVATEILEEYVQVAPVNAHLLYSLAGLQFHLGRRGHAQGTCKKIMEIAPQHSGASDLMNRIAGSDADLQLPIPG
jgi:tetratricopeptide (TPR) repeat protein